MARRAVEAGKSVQVSVQSAFGCGFEGPVAEARVLAMVAAYLEAGLRNISLADTAGHANPVQVERLFGAVFALDPGVELRLPLPRHLRPRHGQRLRRHAGPVSPSSRRRSPVSGGCPFTKVAAGNVATEDVVHTLQRMGERGDVDLGRLIGIARDVAAQLRAASCPGTSTGPAPIAVREQP